MNDDSIVIITSAKYSSKSQRYILRFDLVIDAELGYRLVKRGDVQIFPPLVKFSGQIYSFSNCIFGVKHDKKRKTLMRVELDRDAVVTKDGVTYQKYSDFYLD